jgi:hypothetical protein
MRGFISSCLVVLLLSVASAEDKPTVVTIAGTKSTLPKGWVVEKPANFLRAHQFKLKSPSKDHADAEIVVFGESSPDAEKLFPKWQAQYTPPDGKTERDTVKKFKTEAEGVTIHMLDVQGTWTYRERPNDPSTEKQLPEFRTVWVIIATEDEAAHIRLSGHVSVVAEHIKVFEDWVKTLKLPANK